MEIYFIGFYWIKGRLKWKAICNKGICQIGFCLFFSWLRASSPFHIWLIAKCEISEGHNLSLVLLVRGTEQIPLHAAPVTVKHLSLMKRRWKAVQSAFIQVLGGNTRVRVVTTFYPVGQMHTGVTLHNLAKVWCNPDAPLSFYFVVFCGKLQLFPPHFYYITRCHLLKC